MFSDHWVGIEAMKKTNNLPKICSHGLENHLLEGKKTSRLIDKSNEGPDSNVLFEQPQEAFGKFDNDEFRLEAVKLRELRLLVHGIIDRLVRLANWALLVVVLLFADNMSSLGESLKVLLAFFRAA